MSRFSYVQARGCVYDAMIEGSLEVKLPAIWTDGKSGGGKRQRRERVRRERVRRERVRRERDRRKKIQVQEKVGKSRNTVLFHVFRMFCGSGGLQ